MTYSQNNIEQLFRLIGSFANQQYSHSSHFEFIKTHESIWPNQLFNLNASEDEIELVLNHIENDSEKGLIPDLLVLLSIPKNYPIIDRLRKRAYKASTWTAMTHDLKFIGSKSINSNFHVKLVQNKSDFKAWLTLVETELMGNHTLNLAIFFALLENSCCYFYLGLAGNQPVATSFLFVKEKGAGVYLVSTKSSHRKNGFGKEMTRHCLMKAKDLQCDQVDLQATALGKGIYESLGFVKQGVIDVFRIKKPSQNDT